MWSVSRGLTGPYFFEEIDMGQTYMKMLEIVIPRLDDLFEIENEIYFQQEWDSTSLSCQPQKFYRTLNQ